MTPKQKRFVAEYLIDLNATKAAERAGYSKKTAEQQGCRLLRNAQIKAAVAERTKKSLARLDISSDRVLNELGRLAFFDIRKLYNEDGTLKKVVELDEDTAACVAGFDVEELYEHFGKGAAKEIGVVKKYKLADKGQNLERLGRYHKLFTDKVEVSGMDGLAERIAQARRRAG